MDSGCPSQLGKTADRILHLGGCHHHQIRQLVHDDHDPRHRRDGFAVRYVPVQLTDSLIIGMYVAHTGIGGEFLVTVRHFLHRPVEGAGGLAGIGDHRNQQVRDPVVDLQFHYLRVDHQHLHLIRFGFEENAHDQRVDADRFAGACGAGDQQMRHLLDISHDGPPSDVLSITGDGSLFGTSIPTAAFPGIGASMRISAAARFSLMSS